MCGREGDSDFIPSVRPGLEPDMGGRSGSLSCPWAQVPVPGVPPPSAVWATAGSHGGRGRKGSSFSEGWGRGEVLSPLWSWPTPCMGSIPGTCSPGSPGWDPGSELGGGDRLPLGLRSGNHPVLPIQVLNRSSDLLCVSPSLPSPQSFPKNTTHTPGLVPCSCCNRSVQIQ